MPIGHKGRRLGLHAAVGLLGASAAVAGFALPASAATSPAQNHMIIVSGSNTPYFMMTARATSCVESPGCDLASPSGSPPYQDFRCPNPANTTGGENGLFDGSGAVINGQKQGDPENPYNDVVVVEPPLGSSNGIKQLEQRGTNPAPVDVARSSRAANNGLNNPTGDPVATSATDPEGLNFVAYAQDAVPWIHWTKVAGKKTPSAKIKSLSVAQLAAIYNGTDTNWDQVGGSNAPIDVYMAQAGSGTEGTWRTVLGLTSDTPAGVTNPATHVIFENEIAGIIKNGDEANAIFYFSAGKFAVNCSNAKGIASCNGEVTPGGKSAIALGSESISGPAIAPTTANIENGSFPTDRYLYNVYSNGTNPTIPATSQAGLNFASEWGFICKQDKAVDSNSPTGATYASEIQNVIIQQGFFPLSSVPIDASNVDANAQITDPGYSQIDPVPASPSTATGNCRVFTTDGDGVS